MSKQGKPFILHSPFSPSGDQPSAIEKLTEGLNDGLVHQTLLGVTGSGKTFTIANVIARLNRPAMLLAPNKTLAAQLYAEMKAFFPENAVEYFVSYYDYYQPEAYVPSSDTFIEKDASINDQIEQMRLSATKSFLERRDTIVVASVSAIYGLGDPDSYLQMMLHLQQGAIIDQRQILAKLAELQYTRNDQAFQRGTFRVRGEIIDIFPAESDDRAVRIELFDDEIERLSLFDPLTGSSFGAVPRFTIYPKTHYVTPRERILDAIENIKKELVSRREYFIKEHKLLEEQRISQRTQFDIEMMNELGYCSGIENYSRHMSERKAGDAPYTLIDYFPDDSLIMVDESHVTVPQIRAMYNGDRARKESLIEYGFRLPSALDNRPLKFDEFVERINQIIYVSATPGPYEMEVETNVAEQIIRPTGLLDPLIEIRPIKGQMDDLLGEIKKTAQKGERVLVTTLTKKMAEDLTDFLKEMGVRVRYLHSDIVTIERAEIIRDLRAGLFDVLVGINLLREGLDMPEVSLVAILDADKEGFLRSDTAMIQTIGRAARNEHGRVIMYADRMTGSMERAIGETERRRTIQEAYNKEHGITPKTIHKEVQDLIELTKIQEDSEVSTVDLAEDAVYADDLDAAAAGGVAKNGKKGKGSRKKSSPKTDSKGVVYGTPLASPKVADMTAEDLFNLIEKTNADMKAAAKVLDFERAAVLRDQLGQLRQQWSDMHEAGQSKIAKPRMPRGSKKTHQGK